MINKKIVLSIGLVTLLSTSAFSADVTGDNVIAENGDVFITDSSPSINFNDTNNTTQDYEWIINSSEEYFSIYDNANQNHALLIYSSSHNVNSFGANTLGDITLANDSVFIDKSLNRMGIGTIAPEESLHVSGDGDILLEDSDDDGDKWGLYNWASGKVGFAIADVTNNTYPIKIEKGSPTDTLYLSENGSVGIGTDTPSVKLSVAGDTLINGELNTTKAINATFSGSRDASVYQMLALSANNTDANKKSDSGFSIENARENFKWTFRTWETDSGFAISKVNSGDKEFRLTGSSTADNVELHLSNGAYCDSNGQWHNASSRSYKENISALSGKEAMNTLNSLQSVKYNFKRDKNKETLVGFIAEDMPTLLATKDKKTVDSLQIVSLLTKVTQEQEKMLNKKELRVKRLEDKVSKMEKMITNFSLDSAKNKTLN